MSYNDDEEEYNTRYLNWNHLLLLVFWLKDDTLIYVTNPFGEDLAADKNFKGFVLFVILMFLMFLIA